MSVWEEALCGEKVLEVGLMSQMKFTCDAFIEEECHMVSSKSRVSSILEKPCK